MFPIGSLLLLCSVTLCSARPDSRAVYPFPTNTENGLNITVSIIDEKNIDGEAPFWSASEQALYFVDVKGHTLNRYDPALGTVTRTQIEGRDLLTFAIPIEGRQDHFVVGAGSAVEEIVWNGTDGVLTSVTRTIASLGIIETDPEAVLNDGKCDPSGRLWTGTWRIRSVFEIPRYHLYSLQADHTGGGAFLRVRKSEVRLSNGLAWSGGDATTMYYSDTATNGIDAFDFDINTGTISNQRNVFKFLGYPDGITIDNGGKLWITDYRSGKVLQVDPESGEQIDSIQLPVNHVQSVTFGGANRDILFVTSTTSNTDLDRVPKAGMTFQITGLGVTGLRDDVEAKIPDF